MLPEGAFGKGHGSRALLHALKNNFVMHDSSYNCPMELSGSKQALLQLFARVWYDSFWVPCVTLCDCCYCCHVFTLSSWRVSYVMPAYIHD